MTQEDLAKKVGVQRSQISEIERGKYNPSLKLAFKISKTLKIPLDDLFVFQSEDWDN